MSRSLLRSRMGAFLDILEQAALSLKDHQLRTVLSVLGISIGIAAVILIGTVGKGGRYFIFNELQTFGLKSIWVFRDQKVLDPHRAEQPGTGIEPDDLDAIAANACCNGLALLTPVVYGTKDTTGARLLARFGERYSLPKIEGVGANYLAINNDTLSRGRGFTDHDIGTKRAVVIIGAQVSVELFGDVSHVIGKEISLGRRKFEVIGVLDRKDRSFLASIGSAGGQDTNSRILLPYTRLQQMLGRNDIDLLQAQASANTDPQQVGLQLANVLRRRHHGDFAYKAESMAKYVDTANRILSGVSLIGLVAAAVSLVVAGLGILNIMSTSVLERTREIGIRKAIGGSETEILLQFLLEAAMISTVGGIVGLLLGFIASVAIAALTGFPLIPSIPVIVSAFLVSLGVGFLSGFFPAYRASRLHPVQSLRYE